MFYHIYVHFQSYGVFFYKLEIPDNWKSFPWPLEFWVEVLLYLNCFSYFLLRGLQRYIFNILKRSSYSCGSKRCSCPFSWGHTGATLENILVSYSPTNVYKMAWNMKFFAVLRENNFCGCVDSLPVCRTSVCWVRATQSLLTYWVIFTGIESYIRHYVEI